MSSEQPYHQNARKFFEQYQSLSFDEVHREWLDQLPERVGMALDIGAGSGRDAKALAARGWQVCAVEPADALRALGRDYTRGYDVIWLNDCLPGLHRVRALSQQYSLILVSAVWMHLPEAQQQRALRVLTNLLAPGGLLVITVRQGPNTDDGRKFFPVSLATLDRWAQDLALLPVAGGSTADQLGRGAVTWQFRVFRLPDDGTGALPTLRHVIVNDDKASTYKLGLLRALVRLADTAPGMVCARDDHFVEVPLGAVGLYWLMAYRQLLLDHGLRQSPGAGGYAFAKSDFEQLRHLAPGDMRIGSPIAHPSMAACVMRAIREACKTIVRMPAHYITWPGSQLQIFEATREPLRIADGPVRLDKETLRLFGVFRVPTLLWDTISRYACWLEPAITHEWVNLMQKYNDEIDAGLLHQALKWPESRRDTTQVRRLISSCIEQQQILRCVWSRRRLRRDAFVVDHCFPWVRWQNNDLWNLFPATRQANTVKGDRLPAASLLESVRDDVLGWWQLLDGDKKVAEQFRDEAQASLPLVEGGATVESIFDSLLLQRQRLKANQQLAEWHGLPGK